MSDSSIHLIVPGAQKAGTTWLQHIFDTNQSFWCPPGDQEIHFFDRKYKSGLAYYRQLYNAAPSSKVTVDVTPAYLSCEEAPERMRSFEETVDRKLYFLISFREPVDRLTSAFVMKKRRGLDVTLPRTIHASTDLIKKSRYASHLKRYFSHFPEERFLTIIFEEFIEEKEPVLRKVKEQLSIEQSITDLYENRIINTGGMRKIPFLDHLFRVGGNILRALDATDWIHHIKSSKFIGMIKKANKKPYEFSERQELILQDLKEEFTPEVHCLSKLINRPDLPEIWGYDQEEGGS